MMCSDLTCTDYTLIPATPDMIPKAAVSKMLLIHKILATVAKQTFT